MSGIFGIFEKNGRRVAESDLKAMRAKMEFWGPDGGGLWSEGAVGLGHLLRHSTPESERERQPSVAPWAPGLVIAADARLDHREDLIDALELSPAEGGEASDDLLLLRSWMTWGEGCLDRLHGAFAFALWDARRRTLFCVRDHQGFRPFFYYDGPDRFALATDIEALMALGGVPREPDNLAITAKIFLAFGYLKERSLYRHVLKVPPASLLSVERGGTAKRQYWFPERIPTRPMTSIEDLAVQLRELVERAVKTQLRSCYPIGCHVSGGLDCTSVAVVARKLLLEQQRDLKTAYSWSPPRGEGESIAGDERPRVEAAARRLGMAVTQIVISDEEYAEFANRDLLTQPTSTLRYESAVCRLAAHDGVRVLLSGWGGDEFVSFNGRGAGLDLLCQGRVISLVRGLGRPWQARGRAAWLRFSKEVLRWMLPAEAQPLAWRMPGLLVGGPSQLRALLTKEEWRMLKDEWSRHAVSGGVRDFRVRLWRKGHLANRIEEWAREGGPLGVEYRYPLLDRRIVEFSLGLPAAAYWGKGRRRGLFREVAAPWLPPEILECHAKNEPARRAAGMDFYYRATPDAGWTARGRDEQVERLVGLRRQVKARGENRRATQSRR